MNSNPKDEHLASNQGVGAFHALVRATVADRLLQKAVARILAAIFEAEFCDAQLRVSSGAESS